MKKIAILIFLILVLPVSGCNAKKEAALSGRTMGTTYHIKVLIGYFDDLSGLQKKIETRLDEINRSMSVFQKDSEISRFNALGAYTLMPVSQDFLEVLKIAKILHDQTQGAWDGTVSSLVDLWGFGKTGNGKHVPSTETIHQLLQRTGFQHIQIHPDNTISKSIADISLNLGSIAKGYGVDQVAMVIEKSGIQNYLVEIGGEVSAAGRRIDGEKWRIGINKPEKGSPYTEVYKVVALANKALATSGDYRNFFEQDGRIYSHIIDPKTGFPVSNHVVSVTIIADTCTYADGLATAVMVMGPQSGLSLINRLPDVEGLIITMAADGSLTDHFSNGFPSEP
jgi:thiamine biosynthesis lipoprotein